MSEDSEVINSIELVGKGIKPKMRVLTLEDHKALARLLKEQRDILTGTIRWEQQAQLAKLNLQIRDILDNNIHSKYSEDECRLVYFG